MTDQDLTTWLDAKLRGEEPGVADAEPEDEDELVEGADAGEGDDTADDQEARDFWGAMSDKQRARAEVDEQYRTELWSAWNATDDDDDEAEAEGDEGEDPIPQTPDDIIALAYAREDDMLEAGFDSVEDFLVTVASDARYWLEVAEAQGWPADARPTDRHLPGLELAIIAAGIPGARLVEDRPRLPVRKPRW